MNYIGIRDFRTEKPAELRSDLQRQNAILERAFSDLIASVAQRWRVVIVVGSAGNATHGDLIKAGQSQAASILLPRSTPSTVGRSVRVHRVGSFAVTVAAPSQNNINGSATYVQSAVGWVEYVDDGAGNWMANA